MLDRSTVNPQAVNRFYISAAAAVPKTRILKYEDTFAIFDVKGDLYTVGNDELGIYHQGTRYLSRLNFLIGETEEPLLLNSFIRKENDYLKVELTNPDLNPAGAQGIKKSTVYISRTKFLDVRGCEEEICFFNYGETPITLPIAFEFDADYKDVFEVRGTTRRNRGELLPTHISGSTITLGYRGLDQIDRFTSLIFSEKPSLVTDTRAAFEIQILPAQFHTLDIKFRFHEKKKVNKSLSFEEALKEIQTNHYHENALYSKVSSNSDQFNLWVERSRNDLVMMTTTTSTGDRYPYAGIPWYCTAFGRDGIWTALMCLWANPEMAKQTLQFLAKTQAHEKNLDTEATPGKIFHEFRSGEMANLKEIPFGKYYGTVDATPLYIMLAGEYFDRTGDLETLKNLWSSIKLAIQWVDEYGDCDGDGFVEYHTDSEKGLVNQGWKDSHDSIFHADGSDPIGPIALCEVQGYVYSAKVHASRMATLMNELELSQHLIEDAKKLKEQFDRAFWIPELNTYALALDGKKNPCKVLSSNAGHLFYCGIMKEERLKPTLDTLMGRALFSGWGIRTLGTHEKRYNPISYHNGSVWPHDSTIIAMGLARYGFKGEIEKIFEGLFKVSTHMEQTRMPEVFCGFEMEQEPPTLYPVACSPQAWAAASIYGLLQALLGLELNANQKQIRCYKPVLPPCLHDLKIHDLRINTSIIDLGIIRHQEDVSIRLLKRVGDAQLVIEK